MAATVHACVRVYLRDDQLRVTLELSRVTMRSYPPESPQNSPHSGWHPLARSPAIAAATCPTIKTHVCTYQELSRKLRSSRARSDVEWILHGLYSGEKRQREEPGSKTSARVNIAKITVSTTKNVLFNVVSNFAVNVFRRCRSVSNGAKTITAMTKIISNSTGPTLMACICAEAELGEEKGRAFDPRSAVR